MDKKEFNEINDSLKRIEFFDGTVCERSFINGALQRAEKHL